MEETETNAKELLKEKIANIKKPQLIQKGNLSVFRLFETLGCTTFHFQKYYQQILSQPQATEEERIQNIVEESAESVKKQRSKKKRWLSTIFLLINLAIVVGIFIWGFLGDGNQLNIKELFSQKINWIWFFVGVLVFFLISWADGMRIFTLIFHVTKKPRPFLSYKSQANCRFYDCVTPLSTGGQPFQIYYLSKHGLSGAHASSVPIAKYLYSQFLTMIFVALVLILQHTYIISLNPFILTMCYIGFGLNVLLLGSILFLSVSKKIGPSCAIGILKLLSKMKIVKDYRKSFVKVMHTVRDYVATMKQFMSNIWVALAMLALSVIYFILFYSIPFVVYATFVPLDANWFSTYIQIFTMAVVCDMACSFIPLPGAAGMAELSFATLFGNFFKSAGAGNIAVWALLLWRIFTYYGYLIQGLFIMLYDFLIGNKKYEKQKNKFSEPPIKIVKKRRKK